jgi:fluoride exporter
VAIFYVGIGGMIGSVLRYFISSIPFNTIHGFPLATLLANILGAFFLGVLVSNTERLKVPKQIQLFLGTGAIGSFTTLSAISTDTALLLQDGALLIAFSFIFVSSIGGIAAAFLGMKWNWKQKREVFE